MLTLSDFQYELPIDRISQFRREDVSQNKLLVRHVDGEITHTTVSKLAEEIPAESLVIVNESKVIPGRLFGQLQTGAKIELLLLEPSKHHEGNVWSAMAKPQKKLTPGKIIQFEAGLTATVVTSPIPESAHSWISFSLPLSPFFAWLDNHGFIPLPPYIRRENPLPADRSSDRKLYQTSYSKTPGSVAAPTAGLHLSNQIIDTMQGRGIKIAPITLHVGAGTFLPVKNENIATHQMHYERYLVSKETFDLVNQFKKAKKPIIAVGTTSLRCLESFFMLESPEDKLSTWLETNLFIYPKDRSTTYTPKTASALMTNFHQPGSSLLMLVAALIGFDQMRSLYHEAITKDYRFLSYGDTSLLWL